MKEKRKNLLLAMLFSAIVICLFVGLLYTTTIQKGESLSEPQAFLMEDIVSETLGDTSAIDWFFHMFYFLEIIVCFVVLTLVFYFVIGHLRKHKK